MAGIVLEDNCHLLAGMLVSVLRAASFKGRTLTADNSLRIRIGELIELTKEPSKLAAEEGPGKHPLNSKTRNVNLSDDSHSNFLLNLPTGKEAHPQDPQSQVI
jgi:hypothetical protein